MKSVTVLICHAHLQKPLRITVALNSSSKPKKATVDSGNYLGIACPCNEYHCNALACSLSEPASAVETCGNLDFTTTLCMLENVLWLHQNQAGKQLHVCYTTLQLMEQAGFWHRSSLLGTITRGTPAVRTITQ